MVPPTGEKDAGLADVAVAVPEPSSASTEEARLSIRQRLALFTPLTLFTMLYTASCAFNFGYDVGTFGGVQAMQSFAHKFGEYNETKKAWALSAYLSSLMTALPFLAKALGVVVGAWLSERFGRKLMFVALIACCYIGVTLQVAATTPAQFTVGRCLTFAATGLTVIGVPIYLAETSPRELRGMMNATIQLMISLGGLVASLVNLGTKNMTGDKAWQIPVGVQYVAPVFLTIGWFVLPESPRWLISRNQNDRALQSLRRLSKKSKSAAELDAEIAALYSADANKGKGTWREVFDRKNRVRTSVAILVMFGQQITGQAFVSQYSVVFYVSQGFASKAFLYGVLGAVAGVVCVAITWLLVDSIGRRTLLLLGGTFMAIFIFIVGGISTATHPSDAARHTLVASVILFSAAYSLSWAPISYVVVSEVASNRVKEKTNLLACVVSVLTTFVTSFTAPYLINASYANLGGKVGFIYGSICWAILVLAYLYVPELKGRSLEEVDQLFSSGQPLRKFKHIRTKPVEEDASGWSWKDRSVTSASV
ncbi:hypothetical protein A1O3_09578 [Capronia epimyces CBS 606.96]|uniref:Major facilitator superfamily (MFS) profile domain-containing protein n=1 Tax=Capronia epimyces CBS 606.96 TaxID=1182542 RepID=W9XA73_9EURO|nr:uncharacterized protein A1O3_09578 [Capronia epimyces CBS 606.96]EXJ77352.1 hypothetical protein A1O3_09578 [Capronia epimyces CBS 606.96]